MSEKELPPLYRIRRSFPHPCLPAPGAALRAQLDRHSTLIKPGASIAIAVGSRGIASLREFVAVTASWVTSQGGKPFVVPAMGSHGGATAEGQAQILADYGIREDAVGAPIRSSMEVVELERSGCEVRLYQDRYAYESDGIIVMNRVKPHTDFHGKHESGLLKMVVIGLGKRHQAVEIHHHGVRGLKEIVPDAAGRILGQSKIILGIGIVENAYEQIAEVRAVTASELPFADAAMLEQARPLMPALPVDELDVLIVDKMGKDISGVGLDTNVIGRLGIRGEPDPERPRIRMIIARDLTPASHGNALGMGLADIITRRLYEQIDFAAMYENLYTSTFLERGKIPVIADSDEQALSFALRACPGLDPSRLLAVRIQSTLRLDVLHVSKPVLDQLQGRKDIEVLGPVDWFGEGAELAAFCDSEKWGQSTI